MKKKILILFPYPFTEFNYYKFEILNLKKKYKTKVIIHDLSKVVTSKKFNQEWKTKVEKKTLKFTSLVRWIIKFNSIKKENILIFNFVKTINFNSFVVNLFIRMSNLPLIFYAPVDLFSSVKPYKKNFDFFYNRIKQHRFNLKIYFFPIKVKFFQFLLNFFKSNKAILLSNNFEKLVYNNFEGINKKNVIKKNFNQYDYSNALIFKNKKKIKKKFIVYIDNGAPYFSGDAKLKGDDYYQGDLKKQYEDLNHFFDKLENYFKAKIIIIPHPKYKSPNPKKIKSLNPFFNDRIVANETNSLAKLSFNCLFVINKMSTAISYPIFYNKPVIHIFSSEYNHPREELKSILDLAKSVGHKPIDICNFTRSKIINSLKINKKRYNDFKYNYLTPKNKLVEKTPNFQILNNLTK